MRLPRAERQLHQCRQQQRRQRLVRPGPIIGLSVGLRRSKDRGGAWRENATKAVGAVPPAAPCFSGRSERARQGQYLRLDSVRFHQLAMRSPSSSCWPARCRRSLRIVCWIVATIAACVEQHWSTSTSIVQVTTPGARPMPRQIRTMPRRWPRKRLRRPACTGDFGGVDFEHWGGGVTLLQEGDKYFTSGLWVPTTNRPISGSPTRGVDPLQRVPSSNCQKGRKPTGASVAWKSSGKTLVPIAPPRGELTKRRLAALGRVAGRERQHHVHRLPPDRLRRSATTPCPTPFLSLVGDQRELPILSWSRGGPRDLGEDKIAGRQDRHGLWPCRRFRWHGSPREGRHLRDVPFKTQQAHQHLRCRVGVFMDQVPYRPTSRRVLLRRQRPAGGQGLHLAYRSFRQSKIHQLGIDMHGFT